MSKGDTCANSEVRERLGDPGNDSSGSLAPPWLPGGEEGLSGSMEQISWAPGSLREY